VSIFQKPSNESSVDILLTGNAEDFLYAWCPSGSAFRGSLFLIVSVTQHFVYDEPIGKIKIKQPTSGVIIPSSGSISLISPPLFPPLRTHPRHLLFLSIDFYCHLMDLSSGNAESDCPERSRLYRLGYRNLNQPPRFGGLPSQQRYCPPEVEVQTMQTDQHLVSHYPSHCFNISDWRSLRVTPRRWSTHCLHQIACRGRQTILVLPHSRWQVDFVAFATISHFIF